MTVGLAAVEENGQCNEVAWPYGDGDAADPNAEYYRARGDGRVRTDLVDVIHATLAQGRSLVLALRLTEAWHVVGGDGAIPRPPAAGLPLGGHAVVAVGYDAPGERILIRNSWGTRWGSGGHAWLPDAYVERYVFEAVTLEALPATGAGAASAPAS
jgi:hypothetical protein